MEGSTGGANVEGIFRNCSVLSLSRKALLILFRFILHKKQKASQLFKKVFYKKKKKKDRRKKKIFSHVCCKSVRVEFDLA